MIQFTNVTKRFKNGTTALNRLNLKIADGEFVYVVGMSGAGKSTLTKLIIREHEMTEGDLLIDGWHLNKMPRRKIPAFRRNIGFVYQDFRLLADRTAYENVAFAAECIGLSGRQVKARTRSALDFVGLSDRGKHMPDELSAGEQQRVSIARAIVNDPRIIIADEPTGNLDPETTEGIIRLLERIHATGVTVIMATHDEQVVNHHPHRVITLANGEIVLDQERGGYALEGVELH